MNIYISENIKRLRREKNLTQEALADFIGISFQAVSKWECGDAYPDITLLPVIANYFQVTIDELLGNDKIKSEERIQNYLNEYDRLWNLITDEAYLERVSLIKQAYKEYPYDWRIIDKLCDTFVYGYWNDKENYEENKKFVRKLCNMIYDECTNDTLRRNAITYMVRLSDGEEEEAWLDKIDDRLSQKEEREWNYLSKGRKEEAFLLYQKNVMEYVEHLMWKLSTYHDNYSDLVSSDERIAVLKISADLFRSVFDGNYPNYVLVRTAGIYEEIAQLYFSIDNKENGYSYLEKAVAEIKSCVLHELSDISDIPYKSPPFNRLTHPKWTSVPVSAITNLLDTLKSAKAYDFVRSEERFQKCTILLEELI